VYRRRRAVAVLVLLLLVGGGTALGVGLGGSGVPAVKQACGLLARGEITAQFGRAGPPTPEWPFCRWDLPGESFLALQLNPHRSIAEARRHAYVMQDAAGIPNAFYGTDRALYFGDARVSYRLLYQRASEFTGIRERQLLALAHDVLHRAAGKGLVPVPRLSTGSAHKRVRVFFGGDSLAAGPSWAYLELARHEPARAARAEYEVGTGLLRGDYFDWVRHLRAVVAARHPDVVVYMAGANDSQDAFVGGRYHPVGTAVWKRVYRARVRAAMNAATGGGAQLVWVGMPPMRDATLSHGMSEVNAVFRSETARRRDASYVDTWSLFSIHGRYTDVENGEYVRLPDGIHLNVAGSERLARVIDQAVDRAAKSAEVRNARYRAGHNRTHGV
jgi:lysophospholipase L1-like esterase